MTITEYIKNDVQNRLHTGEPLPFKLTLIAISKHYGVSLTPVRQAIDELVRDNIIQRKSNGRLESAIIAPPQAAADNQDNTIMLKLRPHQDLDDRIRKEVIERSLNRDNEYLREQATAEKYGAGRTVVRQVFSRLAGAGLLEHVPRCGWRVHPFSVKEMTDYLDVREVLELKALDLARPHFKEDELSELLAQNKPGSGKCKSQLDLDMHDYWIGHCENQYIQEFFARYSIFYNTLFNLAVIDEQVKHDMAEEHCEIASCLLQKDWRGARRALSKHIRDQQGNVARMIDYLTSN